jgi:hypothetical protein
VCERESARERERERVVVLLRRHIQTFIDIGISVSSSSSFPWYVGIVLLIIWKYPQTFFESGNQTFLDSGNQEEEDTYTLSITCLSLCVCNPGAC